MNKVKYIQEYIINSADYAAHMNVTHWDTLKRLKIIDGKMCFDTGAILQKVSDRIEMFEKHHDQPEYKQQLLQLEDERRRQLDHLRSV